jgi:hypothetical protein
MLNVYRKKRENIPNQKQATMVLKKSIASKRPFLYFLSQ